VNNFTVWYLGHSRTGLPRKAVKSDEITGQFCLICFEITGKGTGYVTLKGMIKSNVLKRGNAPARIVKKIFRLEGWKKWLK